MGGMIFALSNCKKQPIQRMKWRVWIFLTRNTRKDGNNGIPRILFFRMFRVENH